jgi:L-2-hydroxyglutarate oxidase LhgO
MFRRNSHNYQIDIIASFFAGRPVFSRLIYPVPVPGGLGIHVTLDLAGRMRFGPDVQWTDGYDYEVEPARAASFYPAIRTYWPALPDGSLVPDYSGIRPKLSGPGEPPADFMIDGPAEHGLAGLVQSVRHQIAGADRLAVDRGAGGEKPCQVRLLQVRPDPLAERRQL